MATQLHNAALLDLEPETIIELFEIDLGEEDGFYRFHPGKNGINPKGLDEAASITSQISTLMRRQSIASSLTNAILTLLNVFSRSLVISATFGELTGTTSSMNIVKKWLAIWVHTGVTPPTTLGTFCTTKRALPGSILSRAKAKKKSFPTSLPLASNLGNTNSSVVPGYVVLCSTSNWPARSEERRVGKEFGSRWSPSP